MASIKRDKPHSSLDQKQLRRLYGEGLLPESVFRTFLVESAPVRGDWHLWFRTLLLVVGSALVLAGIFSFFAWNWGEMRPAVKFTLLETGLASAVLAAMLYGEKRSEGRFFLLIASMLTGALLRLCAQVYHSGASAWELLAGWSLLIFGWVAVGRSALLWGLWLVVVHMAFILFWTHVAGPVYGLSFADVALSLALLDIFFLLLGERGWSHGLKWLREKWPRHLLLGISLFLLCLPVLEMILSRDSSLGHVLCVPVWLLLAGGGYIRFRRRFPDLIALGLIIASGCVLLSALAGRLFFAGGDGGGSLFVFALIILMIAGAGAYWLWRLAGEATVAEEWVHD